MTTSGDGLGGVGGAFGGMVCTPDDFPETQFVIGVSPAAVRASLGPYLTFAGVARDTVEAISGLDVAGWQGTEGDLYRARRTRFAPTLTGAQIAFFGVHRVVGAYADRVDELTRRMDVVRPAARVAWQRWQEARASERATLDTWIAPAGGRPISLDPQVGALERAYRGLEADASSLRQQAAQAASDTVAALRGLPPPPPDPVPVAAAQYGASWSSPAVRSRVTTRSGLDAEVQYVAVGAGVVAEIVELADGTYEVSFAMEAEAGGSYGWDNRKETRGTSAPVGPQAQAQAGVGVEATVGAGIAGLAGYLWKATSRQEVDAIIDRAQRQAMRPGWLDVDDTRAELDADGVVFTVAADVTATAGLSADASASARWKDVTASDGEIAGTEMTGAELSAEAGASGRAEVTSKSWVDGTKEATLLLTGTAAASAAAGSWSARRDVARTVSGTVRTQPGTTPRLTVVVDDVDPKDGKGTRTTVTKDLSPAEVATFAQMPESMMKGGAAVPGSPLWDAVEMSRELADTNSWSREVLTGEVDHRAENITIETERTGVELGVGEKVGVHLGDEVTTETLTPTAPGRAPTR